MSHVLLRPNANFFGNHLHERVLILQGAGSDQDILVQVHMMEVLRLNPLAREGHRLSFPWGAHWHWSHMRGGRVRQLRAAVALR